MRIYTKDTPNYIDQKITIYGWIETRRDHGSITFLDIRDRWGLIQAVLTKKTKGPVKDLRPEYVISVQGMVVRRPAKLVNPKIVSGTVELQASAVEIINSAKTPPFELDQDTRSVDEELRLRYRYLDLRTERMKQNIVLRHRTMQLVRNFLDQNGFTEIHTPILTKSTPEGARDYLVPSRKHWGKFFALPQSPQQYKQLLMVAGFDRYFQIAPCFRDEDARADRSPGEFYQIDIEMSFVEQEDILTLTEEMFTAMVETLLPDKTFTQKPWPRLDYQQAIENYGTDKPDLRKDKTNPHELAFAWVLNFPLFVPQTQENYFHSAGAKYAPSHHMFTAPHKSDLKLLDVNPLKVRSYQHDLVLNGFEVGGGSIRIHDPKIQEKVFDLIGFSQKQKQQFAHLLEAFTYGVPPHGGIAVGLDRLIQVLLGEKSIREVIPFPLMADARDPLMDAPSTVEKKQLDELGIQLKKKQ